MKKKSIAIATLVILLIALILNIVFSTPAEAQKGGKDALGADKSLATKQGVSGSLGSKQFDKNKLPGKWKIGFAIGSVITAIAVVKWL